MPFSAFVVMVPAAQARVGPLRSRFDATTALGMPAHVTLLVPFMDPAALTPEVLAQAQAALDAVPAFDFALRRVGRFPETAYLAPEPAQPFIDMTLALARAFPAFPPFGGVHPDVIPHLTAAHGNAADAALAEAELNEGLQRMGPIEARCDRVALVGNATGRWQTLYSFALPWCPA